MGGKGQSHVAAALIQPPEQANRACTSHVAGPHLVLTKEEARQDSIDSLTLALSHVIRQTEAVFPA